MNIILVSIDGSDACECSNTDMNVGSSPSGSDEDSAVNTNTNTNKAGVRPSARNSGRSTIFLAGQRA